jgi:hypothetical protein
MDAFERILDLVAEGRLTAEEAAPLLDALDDRPEPGPSHGSPGTGGASDKAGAGSAIRIEVSDGGRKVVNLRVPLSLGRTALDHVLPGLSEGAAVRIREAISSGLRGPILDIDDGDGDGVRVLIE